MIDEHEFEQQLTAVLERRAAQASPSEDGLRRIEDKARGRRRQRVLAIAASVLVLALVAGAVVVLSRGDDSAELNVVDDSELEDGAGLPGGELLPAMVDLEAALEKEMILAAALLGSGGQQFVAEYEEQTASTDEAILNVEAFLAGYEPVNEEAQAAVASMQSRLQDLGTVRRGVDGVQFKTSVAIDQHLETLDAALGVHSQVSQDAGSGPQYHLLRQSVLLAQGGRESAEGAAVLSAMSARFAIVSVRPQPLFTDSEDLPCASLEADSCSSWQDFNSSINGRQKIHEELAVLGLDVPVPAHEYDQAALEAIDGTSPELDAAAVVAGSLTDVDTYRQGIQSLLDEAANQPAHTPEPVAESQLDLYLAALDVERELRREMVVTASRDAEAQAVQQQSTTAAISRFDNAWVAAGNDGSVFDGTSDVTPLSIELVGPQIDALATLADLRRELTSGVDDVTLFRRLDALNDYADGESKVAVGLAIISSVVAREPQQFTSTEFAATLDALGRADEGFLEWQDGATSEQKSLYRNETSAPEVRAADDMIDRALTEGMAGGELQINPYEWLPAALAKLDALSNVEHRIIDSLDEPPEPDPPSDPSGSGDRTEVTVAEPAPPVSAVDPTD